MAGISEFLRRIYPNRRHRLSSRVIDRGHSLPQLYVRTDFTSVLYSFILGFLLTLSPLIQMFCNFASAAVERRFFLLMSSSSPISVPTFFAFLYSLPDLDSVVCSVLSALTSKLYFFNVFCTSAISANSNPIKSTSSMNNMMNNMKWGLLKAEIRAVNQQFSRLIQSNKHNHTTNLRDSLNHLEKRLSNDPSDKYLQNEINKTKKELEISELEKTRGAQVRARIKWAGEGERSTKFF